MKRIALLVGMLLTATFAQSQTAVSITNYSFENPGNSDGAYGALADVGTTVGATLTQNTTSVFTGDVGNGTPFGADGANVAYMNGVGSVNQFNVGSAFLAGQDYTFTLAIGNRGDWVGLADWRIGIGGVSLTPVAYTTGDGTHAASGTFSDANVTITSSQISSNSLVGTNINLWVELTAQGTAGFAQLNIDNARLTYSAAIPEPSAYALLAFSVIGMIGVARRKYSRGNK